MSRISARGFAVASATAVTTVGAVVGVAAGGPAAALNDNVEATAADSTLLADLPAGQQAKVQTASLAKQADVQSAQAGAAAKKAAEEAARLKAAQDARAKKDAAEKDKADKEKADKAKADKDKADKDAQARDLETQSASRSAGRTDFAVKSSYSVSEVQAIARQIIPAGQFQCFSNIVNKESSWNYTATNGSAFGLVQALPGSKMSSAGSDWRTNPATQIKWGLNYMNGRYGSPCGAWTYWQSHQSY
ncbi:transglycosylase SLT domain-containing protein [Streptomyces sp. NPDC048416]|uniref:aggregation-promoting factor C-terminal-like domain-containing protein n=1 Tax=Streptomyces sp. NPDC048416 TaxID=3365546 RepID=UPI0037209BA4